MHVLDSRATLLSGEAEIGDDRGDARRADATEGVGDQDELEGALADGRFPGIADDLRLYLRIARMDAGAPLPELVPTPPDWAQAARYADSIGLGALAGRLAERASAEA